MKNNINYYAVMQESFRIFLMDNDDLPPIWRVIRLVTIADQINCKINILFNEQETALNNIVDNKDHIINLYIDIMHYSVIGCIQTTYGVAKNPDITKEKSIELFKETWSSANEHWENNDYYYPNPASKKDVIDKIIKSKVSTKGTILIREDFIVIFNLALSMVLELKK